MKETALRELQGASRLGLGFFNRLIRRIESTKPLAGSGVTIKEQENGIEISISEQVELMIGAIEPGEQGEMGDPGDDGEDGADGIDGIDGINGTNGTNGTNGINGVTGATGATGPSATTYGYAVINVCSNGNPATLSILLGPP